MTSDNTHPRMLIRRYVLLLALCVAPRLSAQQIQPSAENADFQAFALDSLLSQGTDYYTPVPVSSPAVIDLLAVAPRLSQQLLMYYQRGGSNPYRSHLPFFPPSLLSSKDVGEILPLLLRDFAQLGRVRRSPSGAEGDSCAGATPDLG